MLKLAKQCLQIIIQHKTSTELSVPENIYLFIKSLTAEGHSLSLTDFQKIEIKKDHIIPWKNNGT